MKNGLKTTEFWVSALTITATVAGALQGVLPSGYATIAAAIASGLYALSRGLTKAGVGPTRS